MDTLHKILQIMWDKGMGERELCQLAGINKSAVTDWKKGKTQSYMKHLPEIAKALGVKEEELHDEKEKPTAGDGEREELLSKLDEIFATLTEEQKQSVLDYAEYLTKKS